jgi:hypothetical protein
VDTPNQQAITEKIPAEAFLIQVAFSALTTQALYVAAKLGIADLLADQPQSVTQLAAATKTHEQALYRILRSLAGIGVFQETEPKVFGLTPYAEPLRTDAPSSMRNGVIFIGEAWHWNVWGELLNSVKTGQPSWAEVHGAEVFDYFAGHPTESEIFNRAMTDMSVSTAPVVVEAYDFSGFTTLVDVAGGHGYLLAQILKANPQLTGVLFDVPSVIAGAPPLLEQEGVIERVKTVTGDFFKSVPANADAYIMKHIIHDWDDERAITILKNIRKGIKPGGKVLLVETVVPEGNEPHYSKLLDLEMLISPGGVERTEAEYSDLFAAAGFRLNRIVPTPSPYSIIEAVPE